jgi:glycosyltransferase involved in cell wall biosynthesis
MLDLTKNEKIELKFLGPEKGFPYSNSKIQNNIKKIWKDRHYVRKFYNYFKINKPDIVHFTFETNSFGSVKAAFKLPILLFLTHRLKIKIIFTLRTLVVIKSDSKWIIPDYVPYKIPDFLLKILLKIFVKTICHFSDKVIVETEENKEFLMEFYGIDEEKIQILLFIGTSSSPKSLNVKKMEELKGKFLGKKIILCFGVISPRKGLDGVIKAFEKIHKTIPDHILVIAGTVVNEIKNYQNSLHEMIKEYNLEEKVKFTGYLDYEQVDILFKMAKMAIFNYQQMPGSPGAVVYALEQKTPCIVTKTRPFREIFGKNGALYVNERNEIELSDTIYKLASDSNIREELKIETQKIAEKLTWEQSSIKLLEIYKKCIE